MHVIAVGNAPVAKTPHAEMRASLIKKVALHSLAEFAFSFSAALIASFFITASLLPTLFIGLAIQCIGSLAIRSVLAALQYRAYVAGRVEPNCCEQGLNCLGSTGRRTLFANVTADTAQTLLHEAGHTLGTQLVYKESKPVIELIPYAGGITTFCPDRRSKLGKWLGTSRSATFVVAAGPLLTLLVSSILLWIGLKLRDSHPEMSAYLMTYSICDFTAHAFYAFSALWTPVTQVSHDFVQLSLLTGLSPLIALVAIVAIPILIGVMLKQSGHVFKNLLITGGTTVGWTLLKR